MLAATEFIGMMRRYPAVVHPIVKTNVIGKNKDYKACHKLWNFIHSYNRVGYKVNIVKQEPTISRQFERDIYNTVIRDYAMLHNNMKFANDIDIDRPKQEREMDAKQIRQMLEEMVLKTSLSDAALKKLVMKELTDLQMKRKAELAELERIQRQKRKEIRKNRMQQEAGELTLEDVDNEKNIILPEIEDKKSRAKAKRQSMRQRRQERTAKRKAGGK